MDEFRKIPRVRPPKKQQAMDGFVPRQRRVAHTDHPSTGAYHDGFERQEGSVPNQRLQQQLHVPESPLAQPVALSHQPRRPGVHRKRRLGWKNSLKLSGAVLGTLMLAGIVIGAFVFGKAYLAAHKIFQGGGNSAVLFNTDVAPEKLRGEGDGRVNALLVGMGGGNRDGAELTDSILIASVDPVAKDVALLSIPRDLWVRAPNLWSMKINAVYVSAKDQALYNGLSEEQAIEAGFDALEATIEEYIGIPIHYHGLVNFQAFKQGVDAVGGVDVNVKEDLYDYVLAGENSGDPLLAAAGLQHFDGRQALLYAQSRSSSNDFERGQRQRELVVALRDKVLAAGTFSNPNTVSKLIDAFGDNVIVNATLAEIMRLYDIGKDIPASSIVSVGLTDEGNVLVQTASINEQSVVIPRAGQDDFSEIQAFVRNTLRDPFLKKENASIAILNGSLQEGLATQKAEELSSYGYNVTIIDSAPTNDYTQTVIYDRTAGAMPYTKSYLEKRVGVTVTAEPSSENPILAEADFIVVLGANEVTNSTD